MFSYVEGDGDKSPLVEPEGVNAGPPVDRGAPPVEGAEVASADASEEVRPGGDQPQPAGEGQGQGELLSRPGSANGLTRSGPGQEFSAEEG